MSNLNCDIYDLPPTQKYREYGVFDQTNDTATVPLDYVPSFYSIPHTGVTSFEFNGTTFYNYNLYEAPIVSYPVYDYISEVYPVDYQYRNSTSFVDVNDDTLFRPLYFDQDSYPVYDYIPEVYPVDYQYRNSTSFVDVNDDTLFRPLYFDQDSSFAYESISSDLSTDSNLSIAYDVSHSNFYSTSIPFGNSFNNISDEDNNSYLLENNDSYMEPCSSSCNSSLTLNENTETDYQNDPEPTNEVENIPLIKNEDSDLQNVDDSYHNISVINIKHDANISNESTVFEHSLDINENELNEICDNYSFITEENKVLDWSIEVENDDLEKDDDDEEEEEDAIKVNYSTLSDTDPYYSKEVVKYLKEQLYLYALSGHTSLKESIPVVDILPAIEEDSEYVENDDISELTVEFLENREGNTRCVIESNISSNITFDISESFIENHVLELENENVEEDKTKISSVTENDTKYLPVFNMSQQNISNSKLHTAQRHEVVNTDDKLPIPETRELTAELSSTEESEKPVENVPKLAETDNDFNASTEMNQLEAEDLSKLQIKVTEKVVSTGDSLCSNTRTFQKSVKNVEKRNKVNFNPVHRNHVHVPSEAGSHGKSYSESNVEKTRESEEKVSIKEEITKFHTFGKWLINLCCCVRKKT